MIILPLSLTRGSCSFNLLAGRFTIWKFQKIHQTGYIEPPSRRISNTAPLFYFDKERVRVGEKIGDASPQKQETIHGYLIHKMHKMMICCYVPIHLDLSLCFSLPFPPEPPAVTSHLWDAVRLHVGCTQNTDLCHQLRHKSSPVPWPGWLNLLPIGNGVKFHGQNRFMPL